MKRTLMLLLLLMVSCAGRSDDLLVDWVQIDLDDIDQCLTNPCSPGCGGSPIVIDLDGDFFHFTSPEEGVIFDLKGDNTPKKYSWPTGADAWLALDRNGNGSIDNGTELFGNYTEQPSSSSPNGFLALAVFDGNQDGKIDSSDPIYADLRLWNDANMNGLSDAEELTTLPANGIVSLSLNYATSAAQDSYGNKLRYRAAVRAIAGSPIGPFAYDVFLTNQGYEGGLGAATGAYFLDPCQTITPGPCTLVVNECWVPNIYSGDKKCNRTTREFVEGRSGFKGNTFGTVGCYYGANGLEACGINGTLCCRLVSLDSHATEVVNAAPPQCPRCSVGAPWVLRRYQS